MAKDDTIRLMLQLAARIDKVRESTRLPIKAKAKIRTNGDVIEGEVENISMNGASVTSNEPVAVNSSVVLTIIDNSNTSRVIYDLKAKVVWVTGNRSGLHFA